MQRTMNVKGFFVLLAVIVIVFLILFLVLSSKQSEISDRERALQVRLTQLEEENRILNDQMSEVGTKNYIVSNAMDKFAYMGKNDIRFEFSNPKALYTYSAEEMALLLEEMKDD